MFRHAEFAPNSQTVPDHPLSRCFYNVVKQCCVALVFLAAQEVNAQNAGDGSSLLISTAQYPIEGNQSGAAVLEKCEKFLKEAIAASAQVIVFPELVTLDAWPVARDADKKAFESDREIVMRIAQQITPSFFSGMQDLAKQHEVIILAGSSPHLVDNRLVNRSILFFPDGTQLCQDKLFLTNWERKAGFSPGDQLTVGATSWGKFAILICYDVEFAEISAMLTSLKPEVIFVPSMTESVQGLERVRWSAQARAVEQHAFVVISSTVGQTSPTWLHEGQSAILAPPSREFPNAAPVGKRNQRDLVFSRLNLDELRASRKATEFYPARDAQDRLAPIRIRTQQLRRSPN